jgi:phosphoribosylanthranilate isomerase
MTLLVKICGVTTEEAVDAAVESGADAVGFVFHAPSPRDLDPARAAALARRLPRGVASVAVTLHPRQADVERVLRCFEPDIWQSDAADFDALRLPAGIECLRVLRRAQDASSAAGRVLFESPASGAGRRADWPAAAALARRSELILGGGLDAGNVGAAIAAVRPAGVDVSSGVECEPGIKDPARIRAFVAAARAEAR